MKFSIIVPVYNVETVLTRCIESILSQTITDFELLLIDDGSKDQSPYICDEYVKKDKRVRAFHLPNGGVSKARNTGLNYAKGEYAVFIDSDDYVDINYLQLFAENISELVISGYLIEKEHTSEILEHRYTAASVSRLNQTNILQMLQDGSLNYACTKCFSMEIIRNHRLRFDETLSWAEDTLFVVEYVLLSSSFSIIPTIGYHYVRYSHETLASRKLTSENAVHDIEYANEHIYNVLYNQYRETALPAMLHRMGAIYKDVLLSVHSTPTCSKSFIKMLFRQKWFRLVLENADTLFPEENSKYRAILKTKSSFLFWLYYRISHK